MSALAEKDAKWIIGAGLSFSLLNIIFIITDQYWALLLPFAAALILALILALDKVLLFLVFSTPLSIFYFNPDLHLGFTLPTEPILFGVLILFLVNLLYRGNFDRSFVFHPLSLAILFNLLWMIITAVSSEMPLISAKYVLARMWFLAGFYFLMSQLFRREKNIQLFFWLFLISLSITAIYTLIIHSQHNFTHRSGTWVMFPFFKEHTVYGAVLAMYIPISAIFILLYRKSLNLRFLAVLIFSILIVAVIFSYTRAAWVSLVAAMGVMFILILKVRREFVMFLIMLMVAFAFIIKDDVVKRFEKNDQVSSDNLTEHVESISNISTDASNLERINRWKSAFRMFEERPILGFGPGTYMFQYAAYQKPSDKTIISTNAGNLGNAHSEYIGPLAESGILGSFSVLLIVVITFITGVRVYKNCEDRRLRLLALGAFMGLITYWTHGFLNNFLDMDKAACPVWGFSALLVMLDIKNNKQRLVKK